MRLYKEIAHFRVRGAKPRAISDGPRIDPAFTNATVAESCHLTVWNPRLLPACPGFCPSYIFGRHSQAERDEPEATEIQAWWLLASFSRADSRAWLRAMAALERATAIATASRLTRLGVEGCGDSFFMPAKYHDRSDQTKKNRFHESQSIARVCDHNGRWERFWGRFIPRRHGPCAVSPDLQRAHWCTFGLAGTKPCSGVSICQPEHLP
jgi:hypothetical protein